jgi:PilZ domain
MADGSERRVARRFTMSLPLRVLPHESRSHELRTQTRDVSYQGLYFHAEAQFEVGNEIEFVLTLPKLMAHQAGEVDIRCRGQIVRVESAVNGNVGVAAKIERYEFLPAAASAA